MNQVSFKFVQRKFLKKCLRCKRSFKSKWEPSTAIYCSNKCSAMCRKKPKKGDGPGRFKKDAPPWNKGMIGFGSGRKTSANTRIKMSIAARKARPKVVFMVRDRPPIYQLWRTSVFERDNYTCKECNKRGGILHADHILPFCIFKENQIDIENGRTLCEHCHKKTITYGKSKKWLLKNFVYPI